GELELLLATQSGLDASNRRAIMERIAAYRRQEALLTSEPDKGEGQDELYARGQMLNAQRDLTRRQDPYFDHGQALLQIAIVLASVAIVSGGRIALSISTLLGLSGSLLTLRGFSLGSPETMELARQILIEMSR